MILWFVVINTYTYVLLGLTKWQTYVDNKIVLFNFHFILPFGYAKASLKKYIKKYKFRIPTKTTAYTVKYNISFIV